MADAIIEGRQGEDAVEEEAASAELDEAASEESLEELAQLVEGKNED
jgi:small subunit ribosomal protein S2